MNGEGLVYRNKINMAKVLVFGCIFLMSILFINIKVSALSDVTILSSTYTGNGNNSDAVVLNGDNEDPDDDVTYIQGSGISNYDGITFKISNMYNAITDFTAFAVWEANFSSAAGEYADYDRWYLRSITCSDASECVEFEAVKGNERVAKDLQTNAVIYLSNGLTRYYIERSPSNIVSDDSDTNFVTTVVDFSKFFTAKEITYTYRIRNSGYINTGDGFGYKEFQINYWKAGDGTSEDPYDTVTVQFGLARAISDVESYTNYNNSTTNTIACSLYSEYICIDYADTNGQPSASTTVPKAVNIYIPSNVVYSHASTTREEVIAKYVDNNPDMNYVKANNTLYALNYFCEGSSISLSTISYDANGVHSPSCGSGTTLRKYLYVESALVGNDIDDVAEFSNKSTAFISSPYQVSLTVDSRGNYVVVIRDCFGNINEVAVIKVMDIINQALLAYFSKSNKTSETVVESEGWRAKEYLTNNDVTVSITMSATTVIEQGLPIIAAQTTLLDSEYVKNIYYWRVDGDKYLSDICGEGEKENCATMPSSDNYKVLYRSNGSSATTSTEYVSFVGNVLSLKISSNGRYRFYIETFAGNNTNTNEGEHKNPRVEIYKIDKEAPEILFGGVNDSYCSSVPCKYVENTYTYYQGTGNKSGAVIPKLPSDGQEGSFVISYSKNSIYYVSANGESSLLNSASDDDIFFTYLRALFNSGMVLNENLRYYDDSKTLYAHFLATNAVDATSYVLDNTNLTYKTGTNDAIDEETYRQYIISNNIKYTAYSLASNPSVTFKEGQALYEQNRIHIEYLDGSESDKTVCDKLGAFAIDLNGDDEIDQTDCVNYYLDHGIDFNIRLTAYDIVQDALGNYILGNSNTRTIYVDVKDTTAPGFNKTIKNYNVGGQCRVEIGNALGVGNQTMDDLIGCYGIVTSNVYNYEDNVFKDYYTQNQTVNTRAHIHVYILSKETGTWVSLDTDEGYIPNRSGKYTLMIIISDDASTTTTFNLAGSEYNDVTVAAGSAVSVSGNAIATLTSYYVDKKIVLITPLTNEKVYGEEDPIFGYCVSINKNNGGVASYLAAPFATMSVFTQVGCTTLVEGRAVLADDELEALFQGNKDIAAFTGQITRQESALYNDYYLAATSNDYVGVYKLVLGSLNISDVGSDDGYDTGTDYIVKINPNVRNGAEYQLATNEGANSRRDNNYQKCNLVNSQVYDGRTVSGCYDFKEDDDFFVESTVKFTIRQAVLTVTANGASKTYGDTDPNHNKFNSNNIIANAVIGTAAYLNGYAINGLKYTDSSSVVLGVLRREIGEDVGVYAICNYRGTALVDNELETINNMLVVGSSSSSAYTNCSTFDSKASVTIDTSNHVNGILEVDSDYMNSRALYIATNKKYGFYKTLNVTSDNRNNNYANYVINYVENVFEIEPAIMVVQPTPGQRREYSYSGVDEVNPWELVVYGSKTFDVEKDENVGFNGFTQKSPTYGAGANDTQSRDYGSVNSGTENYNNASEARDIWKLILNNVTYTGFKTNETYSLFEGRISLLDKVASNGVYEDMNAGWYNYNELANSTLAIIVNGRKQCQFSNHASSVDKTYDSDCRNYNLTIDLDYRNNDGYKNGDVDANGDTVTVVYKSKLGYCRTTTLGAVSDADVMCSVAQSSKILFEVYRREIILEFNSLLEKIPSTSADMVYGYRYDYYYQKLFQIGEDSANKNYLENSLFYCYASYTDGLVGLSGDCTGNKWYGLTEDDTWINVGLEFHLHNVVSSAGSGYYVSDIDKAIPAGRYYVYSTISDEAKVNYKYNYLGGTLTIKTKSVGISLTDYQKEYGNVYYDNVACLKDGSFLGANDALVATSELLSPDCADTSNEATNTYGFVITGLDAKDTISDNFTGRPIRNSNLANTNLVYTDANGLQENVGVYTIKVGSIHSKNNNTFRACSDNFVASEQNCVVVDGVDINNYITGNDSLYMLTYHLLKNGTSDNDKDYESDAEASIVNSSNRIINEAKLTINPATITIKVSSNQTKMYGCAYNSVNTTSSYYYTYAGGYDCTQDTGRNYDLGYEYTVSGDKDYYIYNNGYYTSNYDFDATYTSSKINMVVESGVDSTLLINGSLNVGLRSSALNGGVLYRVNVNKLSSTIAYSTIIGAANKAQALTHYQGQKVGKYAITLGNLDATLTSKLDNYNEANNKVCDTSNVPGSGSEICKNYIIEYHGNKSTDVNHRYSTSASADTTFTITNRIAFIYSLYNSKVYGNPDPVVTKTCDTTMIDNGVCRTEGATISFGLSEYYTKYNSLAKAPWVASIETDVTGNGIYFATSNVNDIQVDVVSGSLSRVGMANGVKQLDDVVGTYNYLFDSVVRTDYSRNNYNLNHYYRAVADDGKILIKDGAVDDDTNPYILDTNNYNQHQAVNANGGNTQVVDAENKKVLFEINLRKITVTLISFNKVYGIQDDSTFFELGVCATSDQYLDYDEKGNPICKYVEGKNSTEHGLSPTHTSSYVNVDGTLKQDAFRTAFNVKFVRSLGENVVCPNSKVSATITGFFADRTTSYTYDLGCGDNGGYEALGIINQSSGNLGYNYEITYVEGTMNIIARNLQITPESNQGFQYGSYTSPSLIPAIKFESKLTNANYHNENKKVVAYNTTGSSSEVVIVNRDATVSETEITTSKLGLVNGGDSGRVCLKNIDGSNEFCINDRKDLYDNGNTEKSISRYTYNTNGIGENDATYVFGDIYSSESSTRSALSRSLGSISDARYNRNVGVYTITQGDLVDKTGNYHLNFTTGVSYTITAANVKITPKEGQNKVYGEADKELMFNVETTYKVNNTQYVTYDSSIVKIIDSSGNDVTVIANADNLVKVTSGSTIVLSGYAYYENNGNNNYNYGLVKNSNKSGEASEVSQTNVSGKPFDKYCYDNYADNSNSARGVISGCENQSVSFSSTKLVLVGYLYVSGYKQKAGVHLITSGLTVAKNEFGLENYSLEVVDTIEFEIYKLDINIAIVDVEKSYGQASDGYKCESGVDCSNSFATLSAQDNEKMLEYNFNISYKDSDDIISASTYDGEPKVLMVYSINGNYYTQSEGQEDKNNFLGLSVVRVKEGSATCTIDTDVYGCEDVGTYKLAFRKTNVVGASKDGSTRYDDNYNLMSNNVNISIEEVSNIYVAVKVSDHTVEDLENINIVNGIEGSLAIEKRSVDIFVNTNLNSSGANYYEIEQNIEVPDLPTINNSYDLVNYVYDSSKQYHGTGEDASSSSANADLATTYTRIVWGQKPKQVRTADALVGELAYCNEASNGNLYSDTYPGLNTLCGSSDKLVYNSQKSKVNTNTKEKFILITRDVSNAKGLKIMSSASSSGVTNNDYEIKNYDVSFYPGAVHVIGDTSNPNLVVGNKDYYIEANASRDNGNIVGTTSSVGTILEYLFNGSTKQYVLASVDDNGNMYITVNNTKIDVTQASLELAYGNGSDTYPGIVSGVEQTGIYPFISNYAHMTSGGITYLNEDNIKSLESLITTFIDWFKVSSYDSGQYLNGQYLQRKFDKYYYLAINKYGYDVASDIGNEFAINKVATYTVSFYVMDNAGRVSDDGNIAKLHIVDTTAPSMGELTLYNTEVACDSGCNYQDQWYIKDSLVRLTSFNRYSAINDDGNVTYQLDSAGEYIYFAEIGSDNPYKKISDLSDLITTTNYIDYIDTSDLKYSAKGVIHYGWNSNPNGIYLTITGGSDNSYTVEGDSVNSQWKHYYSVDGGFYWMEYTIGVSYQALTSDGIREILITTIDSGIKNTINSYTYSISYQTCYNGCSEIELHNKVDVDGTVYLFNDANVVNRYFYYDAATKCIINNLATLITCTTEAENADTVVERVKLTGNTFTYKGNAYTISGNNVLDISGGARRLYGPYVKLNGIDYRYDSSAMMLYREYFGELGDITENGRTLTIGDTQYMLVGSDVLLGGITVATVANSSFTLNGVVYNYVEDASSTYGYYYASVPYVIYQDTFTIDGTSYNVSSFVNGTLSINRDILTLTTVTNYTNTYNLYDEFLLGVDALYTDSVEAEEDSVNFRTRILANVAWNEANKDSGSDDVVVSKYLNVALTTLYYKYKKTAYLDITAPIVGINTSTVIDNANVNVTYGDDWYVYEYGYYNVMNLTESLTYKIRGSEYIIDKDELIVTDSDSKVYPIKSTELEDTSRKYVYQINYTNYYINEEFTAIKWLNGYIERFVGGKDTPSTLDIKRTEVKYYNINTSIYLGKVTSDIRSEYDLIGINTNTTTSSGIGSDKYITGGKSSTLFDFVYLGQYEQGVYHEDIDYIVYYKDASGKEVSADLSEQFKTCYLADGKITQDCAQKAIASVVVAPSDSTRDVTYTINYVIRDKAGNASTYAARGVLYATILPSTNIVFNSIEEGLNNSGVSVQSIGDDTYAMSANQGVSLNLLQEAFSVNYSSYFTSYNSAAVMTIYRDDELLIENAKGVDFTKYINSDDIADYTIVYNMESAHTTYLDQEIDVSGKTITLHLSIGAPEILEDSEINLDKTIKNDATYVLWAILVGVMFIVGIGFVLVKKRK